MCACNICIRPDSPTLVSIFPHTAFFVPLLPSAVAFLLYEVCSQNGVRVSWGQILSPTCHFIYLFCPFLERYFCWTRACRVTVFSSHPIKLPDCPGQSDSCSFGGCVCLSSPIASEISVSGVLQFRDDGSQYRCPLFLLRGIGPARDYASLTELASVASHIYALDFRPTLDRMTSVANGMLQK